MTVCFFSAQYLPTVGGVERYTFNIARRLRRAGHRVLVVTSALPELPSRETDEHGIEIFRLPVLPLMNGRFPLLYPCPAARKALRELWDCSIDFCVIQTKMYTSSVYAAFAAKKHGIPAIVIEHSTGHMEMNNPVLNALGRCYEHLACTLIRSRGPAFYGVSQAVCSWLEHFGIRAEGTLYNAVDPDELAAVAAAAPPLDWRASLGLSPDIRLIAFVGRVIPEKGTTQLVQAFRRLARTDTALVLAGDGPQLSQLRRDARAGEFYPGALPYPRTLQLLQQADLYCLPTFYAEGFPTTFLEAAACGCPILTTQTGGSEELMPDRLHGICLAAPDPEALSAELARALDDPAWRAHAARLCGQRLRRQFTWDAVTEHLERIMLGAHHA